MRMFPVNPGARYTGCQWFWIAYARADVWDYSSATYYDDGVARIQRITYPPLPVQITIQKCVFGADGRARKIVEGGNDWQIACRDARQMQTPKEGDSFAFFYE